MLTIPQGAYNMSSTCSIKSMSVKGDALIFIKTEEDIQFNYVRCVVCTCTKCIPG